MLKNNLKSISKYVLQGFLLIFFIGLFLILSKTFNVYATTLLSDNFTGTTINSTLWTEIDPGGTSVSQNDVVTISGSYTGGHWGQTGLDSKDTFSRTNLSVSAVMSSGSAQLLGYGDRNFDQAGTAAYIIDLTGSSTYALSWNNGSMEGSSNLGCGTPSAGAKYTLKPTVTGFSIYKDTGSGDQLVCSATVSTAITNKGIFLASDGSATFDDVTVSDTTVYTVPSAIVDLSASLGNAQSVLSWSAPANNGAAITDYSVDYRLLGAGSWTPFSHAASTNTTITVTGLVNESTYQFRVRAINSLGTAADSNIPTVTPSANTPIPQTVSGLALWLDPADAGSVSQTSGAITQINDKSGNGRNGTASGAVSPTYVSSVQNGKSIMRFDGSNNYLNISSAITYKSIFIIAKFNGASFSSYNGLIGDSSGVSPTGGHVLDGVASTTKLAYGVVNFTNAYRNGVEKTGSGGHDFSPINEFWLGSFILTAGQPNTTSTIGYISGATDRKWNGDIGEIIVYDRVVSDPERQSLESYLASKWGISIPSAPDAPTIGTATPGNTQASVAFTPPVNNGGSAITNYTVTSSPGGISATGTSSPIVVTGLTNGVVYTFTVNATNAFGTSVASASSSPVTVNPAAIAPSAPQSLTGSAGNASVSLSWSAPIPNGGPAVSDYLIEYKLTSEPTTWTTFNDGVSANTTATVTSLTNNLSYDFRVSAINSVGTGPNTVLSPATGGSITSSSGYTIHTFTSSGTFTAPDSRNVEVLVVAGGGGGGQVSGGGGAGGLIYYGSESPSAGSSYAVTSNPISVTVGNGGNGAPGDPNAGGSNGENSVFGTLTAIGGGGGAGWNTDPANNGGSGGGANSPSSGADTTIGLGTSGQGNNGGSGVGDAPNAAGGGGGGAGAVGGNAASASVAGNGGDGLQYSISGTPTYYAGGGGAGKVGAGTAGTGGLGGGGNAGTAGGNNSGSNGVANTGGGGGGGSFLDAWGATGGNGGKGIVIVRYRSTLTLTPFIPTVSTAPIIGTATAGDTIASVTFTTPVSNGGSTITGYTVTSNPGNITATGNSSPIEISGLTNGQAYTFTVTATNGVGVSAASAASNSVTPHYIARPSQVTGLSLTGVNKQVLASWTVPSPGDMPITDYVIEYKLHTSSSWNVFSDGISTASKTIVTGLSNGTSYDFRVSAKNIGGTGPVSDIGTASPKAISTLAFVITGESNSGGIGPNSSATVHELSVRPAVQITNLTSGNFLYEDLHIGVNNLRDHDGLGGYYDTSHGFELELANKVEENYFPDNPMVYLTKTGQGGSMISQWGIGSNYWNKFLQRTAAAKTQLPSDKQWVVLLSLGINDAISGTPTSTFKSALIDHINKIKVDLPGAIIVMTEFEGMPAGGGYPTYNTVLREIAATEPNVYSVDTTGTSTDGGNHWLYTGLKQVTDSMLSVVKTQLGLVYPGLVTSINATPGDSQVSLSWVAPVSNGGSSITDYQIEYKLSTDSEYTTFVHSPSTSTSRTVTGLRNGLNYDFKVSAVNTSGAGNVVTTSSATNSDTVSPTGGSITYTNETFTEASIPLVVNDGTDAGIGVNTSSRVIQRKSATLSSGTCGSYSTFETLTPTGTYPNFTDTTVTTGNCYMYRYLVSDLSSNLATYVSSNVAKVDTTPALSTTSSSSSRSTSNYVSSSSESSESSSSSSEESIGKTLVIKVEDKEGNPVEGAKVELHSDVQIAYTNKNGLATFNNVIGDKHEIVVSYGNSSYSKSISVEKLTKDTGNQYVSRFALIEGNKIGESSSNSSVSKSTQVVTNSGVPTWLIIVVIIILAIAIFVLVRYLFKQRSENNLKF